ncbi:MAG: alpha-L-fucosidase, partial [Bacillota bacterium]
CTFNTDGRYPGYNPEGYDPEKDLGRGHIDGKKWVPPEADVSIRPGWFYHRSEDEKVKTASELLDLYYKSVGRGTNLLLNIPPDRRGLIPQPDYDNLIKFKRKLDNIFTKNLAESAKVKILNTSGRNKSFSSENILKDDFDKYWAAEKGTNNAELNLSLPQPVTFDHIVLQEYITLGQRIKSWDIKIKTDKGWKQITEGTTIGYKRIIPVPCKTTSKLKININESKAAPVISRFALYKS